MAEEKTQKLEREYIIPLRREWQKVVSFRRAGRAAKAIKQFIAKHMKVEDRNIDNVKLDMYLNNELWFRGRKKPPAKIKVKAVKEGNVVQVTFAETPKHVGFLKARHEKLNAKAPEKKKEEAKPEAKKEETKEIKEEKIEEKKVEVEKEKAVAILHEKEAEAAEKTLKHTSKVKPETFHRKAMKR